MGDLIDTTEMYLRTVQELIEEGVVPMRARIAERLHQSGPTVSQTVARMARDGLITVRGDRQLELTADGQVAAVAVMRRHRLVECLLVSVIGLDLTAAHDEACRWEHVVGADVERRLLLLLGYPTESPYGAPIPGLAALAMAGPAADAATAQLPVVEPFGAGVVALATRPRSAGAEPVLVRRLSEYLQADRSALTALVTAGALPRRVVTVRWSGAGVEVQGTTGRCELTEAQAAGLFVAA